MAQFRAAVVTKKGKELMTRALSEQKAVIFTSLKVGAGSYTGGEVLENSTTLKDLRNSYNLTSIKKTDDNTLKIVSAVKNNDVSTGYSMTEYGVFAKLSGETEELVCIATAISADYLPDFSSSPVTVLVELYMKLTNAVNVQFTYAAPSGIYATVVELQDKADRSVVERLLNIDQVFLPVSNWHKTGDYYWQEASVAGITVDSNPVLVKYIDYSATTEELKAYNKNFSRIAEGAAETRTGSVVFKILKKPTQDIRVGLKGA